MPAFILKDYQQGALETLKAFLTDARGNGLQAAYDNVRGTMGTSATQSHYRAISGLERVPYVCIRIPTGGGKTILAAYTIPVVSETWLEQEYPIALWLVPTNTIREQALAAMKDPSHPYRLALNDTFGSRVRVYGLDEMRTLQVADLGKVASIFVSTMQALRVGDTAGRTIYEHHEEFEAFGSFLNGSPFAEKFEQRDDGAGPKFSFANILAAMKPLVIVDEAHNARTSLTFETLERFNPGAIVEFTATPSTDPRTGSNVIVSVGAKALKDADMIKLPIVLNEHKAWQESVAASIQKRSVLAQLSSRSGDKVRPIVLFQAQPKSRVRETVTVDLLRDYLIESEGISAEAIARATAENDEISGLDLFAPDCPVHFIITVSALREGWDCSYAYVLCSVDNIKSPTAVEQILGRILRLPDATKRAEPALNKAYAYVVSPNFSEAANALTDKIVSLGFNVEEFADVIEPGFDFGSGAAKPKTVPPLVVELSKAPVLLPEDALVITVTAGEGGIFEIQPAQSLEEFPETVREAIVTAAPKADQPKILRQIKQHEVWYMAPPSPFKRGEPFVVPQLSFVLDGDQQLVEPELLLEDRWHIGDWPAELPGLTLDTESKTYLVDLSTDERKIEFSTADDENVAVVLPGISLSTWSKADLVNFLGKKATDAATPWSEQLAWFNKLVENLTGLRNVPLVDLVTYRLLLAQAIVRQIGIYRREALKSSVQALLFAPDADVRADLKFSMSFGANYVPSQRYGGSFKFKKHYHDTVGDLKAKGEEYECAKAIELSNDIAYWIRNLAGRGHRQTSFWLPTSSDAFYPDFMAKLKDGRLFAIEYKGQDYVTNDDSKEKIAIGRRWEEASNGSCLFLMAVKRDEKGRSAYEQIKSKIRGSSADGDECF